MKTETIEYAVNYGVIDPVKRLFQQLGAQTSVPSDYGVTELPGRRGESVHIVQVGNLFIGSLVEGLGTRGLVADEIYKTTGVSHYEAIGRSAAETILNDLATSGIQPVACFMYLSAGSNEVFEDMRKMQGLGQGWQEACIAEGAVWGGGETPMLKDVLMPGVFEIAGSTYGIMRQSQEPIDSGKIRVGDRIIGLGSSGPHDNGLTLARDIRTQKLQELGYQTPLSDGMTFGEALMVPTVIYGPFVRHLLERMVSVHAAWNITGHGLAKIARATAPLDYVVENLPDPQPVFPFIQEQSGLSNAQMYSKFNMGVGFVLIVPESDAEETIEAANLFDHKAWDMGSVQEPQTEGKRVLLPNGVIFTDKDVAVR